jgi:hypothetical protein
MRCYTMHLAHGVLVLHFTTCEGSMRLKRVLLPVATSAILLLQYIDRVQ